MSYDASKMITTLQADIAARLLASDYFHDVIVINVAGKTTSDLILQRMGALAAEGGKLPGLAVLVLEPEVDVAEPNIPGPQFDVVVPIQIVELPEINRNSDIGLDAPPLEVALNVIHSLHHYHDALRGASLYAQGRCIRPVVFDIEKAALPGYELEIRCPFGFDSDAAPHMPVITAAGDLPAVTVTMTCATAGAQIWFTRDGTYPWENGTAELYASPFVINTATTLRACAVVAGQQQSAVAFLDIE